VVAFFAELANREIGVPGGRLDGLEKKDHEIRKLAANPWTKSIFEKSEPPKKKRFPLRR
jgi:hypothetical protein